MNFEAFGWPVHKANDLRVPSCTKEDPKRSKCDPYTLLHHLTQGDRPTDRNHRHYEHQVCIFLDAYADAVTVQANIAGYDLDCRSTGRLLASNETHWTKIRQQSLFRQPKAEIVDPCGFRRRLKQTGDGCQRNFDVGITETFSR